MKLTIEQTLQQGVTAHKEGKLQDAERLYRAILQSQPAHPDANHNLGILAVSVNKADVALPLFKTALETNPKIELFWLSYINALIKEKQFDNAKQALKQADKQGVAAEKLNVLEIQLNFNLGNTLLKLERLDEALASYSQAIEMKPDFAQAHYNLGNTLQELGRLDEALASYSQAIALKPDFAEAHTNLGNTLKKLGRLDEALASYNQAIALKPDYAKAHFNLGNTLIKLERLEEAQASYSQAIALKPDYSSAKHMLAALTGETTETAPRDYVKNLFDNFAAKFESSLVDDLEYKIPRVIAEIIIKDSKFDLLGSIVDLGCGTGLFGVEIKQFCEHLEGIDLSEKMLDEAMKKDIYNKLIKEDILAYLSNASLNFDYFVSTDVFVYIGDLSDIFRLIKSRNTTGGKLVFTTEDYDGDGFFLEQSGRYSHSKKYIVGLCKKFGFELRHFETQALRKEKNQYISGGLYILEF